MPVARSGDVFLDVVGVPAEISAALAAVPDPMCAVIDVIRATTTLTLLGERHLSSALVVDTVAAARAAAAADPGLLLAGEVHARPPPGFDLGNSPAEIAGKDVAGRRLVLSTTNGTRALVAAWQAGARTVLVAALRNASAVAQHICALPPTSTFALICAGRDQRLALDDLFTAGMIVRQAQQLAEAGARDLTLSESAQVALLLTKSAGDPLHVLTHSTAGQSVTAAGLAADLPWCAALDATALVPTVVAGPGGHLLVTYPSA